METFPSLLQQHASQRANHTALRIKRYGIWLSYTWQDVEAEVKQFACGFASKGLKPGDKIAIIGNNVPPLYFSILAAQSLGAIPVPLHADSTTEELKISLENCEASFAVLQDQQQVDAIYAVIAELPNLTEVIYFDERGMKDYDHTHLKSYIELENKGDEFASAHPKFFDDASAKVTPDSDAFIVYTAGTSGSCRGAVLTHSNFLTVGQAFVENENIGDDEEVFAYMPLSYASTLFFVYTLWMIKGYTINCPESNETIFADMREVGPTLLYGPPHFYKTIYGQINSRGSGNKSTLLQKHMSSLMTEGRTWLGDKLVFNPMKDLYGLSKVKRAYVGGDVVGNEVITFFRALGLNLKATYGSAESAGCITVQGENLGAIEPGETKVGTPLKGVEVKVGPNDEILFKGPNAFKGFYRDTANTSESITADGWVRTGDIGKVTGDEVSIIERSDSMGTFNNGAPFVPKQIENSLKASPYIRDAVVIGEGRDHIVAMIVIDGDTVGSWADFRKIQFTGLRDLATKPEVIELISERVRDTNTCINQYGGEKCPPIKRYTILNREFNIVSGELTRSYKVRRHVIGENYNTLVTALFNNDDIYEVTDSRGEVVTTLKLQTA